MAGASHCVAILQPGYLPWLGFFELMARADTFVYLDNVQYTKQDWRNRNRILVGDAVRWLTVPVRKSPSETRIRDVRIAEDGRWRKQHLSLLQEGYRKAPCFRPLYDELAHILNEPWTWLWELDVALADRLRSHFGIDTAIRFASELPAQASERNARLLDICRHLDATHLYDSQAASAFVEEERFAAEGITLVFQDYRHPVYPQTREDFVSHLSAVDLLFHEGPEARRRLLSSPRPARLPPR